MGKHPLVPLMIEEVMSVIEKSWSTHHATSGDNSVAFNAQTVQSIVQNKIENKFANTRNAKSIDRFGL
jgi:hypothetical protein